MQKHARRRLEGPKDQNRPKMVPIGIKFEGILTKHRVSYRPLCTHYLGSRYICMIKAFFPSGGHTIIFYQLGCTSGNVWASNAPHAPHAPPAPTLAGGGAGEEGNNLKINPLKHGPKFCTEPQMSR